MARLWRRKRKGVLFLRIAERGTILIIAVVAMILLVGMSGSFLAQGAFQGKFTADNVDDIRTLYVAEAGLSRAIAELNANQDLDGDGSIGTAKGSVGGGTYAVTMSTPNPPPTPTAIPVTLRRLESTGTLGRVCRAIETYAEAQTNAIFSMAAFGDQQTRLHQGVFTDSYDSALGSYDSQRTDSFRGIPVAKRNGGVGSNGEVRLQNLAVMGSATPGPGNVVEMRGDVYVDGSTAPTSARRILPPVEVPSLPSQGDFTLDGGGTAVIPSGAHRFDKFHVHTNSTVIINGPAVVVVDDVHIHSRSNIQVNATNGPVRLYVTDKLHVHSDVTMRATTDRPADFSILMGSADDLELDPSETDLNQKLHLHSGAALMANIYAPRARAHFHSRTELLGAVVAGRIKIHSDSRIHYDEALGRIQNGQPVYQVRSWRELPRPCQ